ncbi:MAG: hypothetical protein ACAF42_07385 [Limnothrix sp. BL-A-16]
MATDGARSLGKPPGRSPPSPARLPPTPAATPGHRPSTEFLGLT